MKKLTLLLSIFLSITLVGCGSSEDESTIMWEANHCNPDTYLSEFTYSRSLFQEEISEETKEQIIVAAGTNVYAGIEKLISVGHHTYYNYQYGDKVYDKTFLNNIKVSRFYTNAYESFTKTSSVTSTGLRIIDNDLLDGNSETIFATINNNYVKAHYSYLDKSISWIEESKELKSGFSPYDYCTYGGLGLDAFIHDKSEQVFKEAKAYKFNDGYCFLWDLFIPEYHYKEVYEDKYDLYIFNSKMQFIEYVCYGKFNEEYKEYQNDGFSRLIVQRNENDVTPEKDISEVLELYDKVKPLSFIDCSLPVANIDISSGDGNISDNVFDQKIQTYSFVTEFFPQEKYFAVYLYFDFSLEKRATYNSFLASFDIKMKNKTETLEINRRLPQHNEYHLYQLSENKTKENTLFCVLPDDDNDYYLCVSFNIIDNGNIPTILKDDCFGLSLTKFIN